MAFNRVFCAILLFLCAVLPVILSTKLCPKDNYWYDDFHGKCRPCVVCKRKFLEIKPCSEFSNTMCVDPSAFTFLKKGNSNNNKPSESATTNNLVSPSAQHKWHEMETMDGETLRKKLLYSDAPPQQQQPQPPQTVAQAMRKPRDPQQQVGFNIWDVGIVAVLCVTLTAVLIAVFSMMLKQIGRIFNRNNARNGIRNRLFSRDRLSTTEYMNSLATLDRRLAMDEILEKKKRAVFEPQLLAENIYSDEVFVSLSGTPRHPHHYEELRQDDQEPTRGLLQLQQRDQQNL